MKPGITKTRLNEIRKQVKSRTYIPSAEISDEAFEALTIIGKEVDRKNRLKSCIPILLTLFLMPVVFYYGSRYPEHQEQYRAILFHYFYGSAIVSILIHPPNVILDKPYFAQWLDDETKRRNS